MNTRGSTMASLSGPSTARRHAPPRAALWAVAALLLVSVVASGLGRSGRGQEQQAITGAAPVAAPLQVLAYTFHDRRDGGIDVRRAGDEALVYTVAPQSNGFLRGTLRGVARERKLRGLGPALPVLIETHANGRVLLRDPATGWQADLQAFGPTNAAAFAPLLPQ